MLWLLIVAWGFVGVGGGFVLRTVWAAACGLLLVTLFRVWFARFVYIVVCYVVWIADCVAWLLLMFACCLFS